MGDRGTKPPTRTSTTVTAAATSACMITDISRNGLAMAPPYPFFAGALAVAGGAAELAGRACTAGGGVISAEIWNRNVFTARFFSSFLVSLISKFLQYT